MTATHRVTNHANETIGFLANTEFFPVHAIEEDPDRMDNLTMTASGILMPEKPLPEIPYREAVNRRIYERLAEQNPFVRDIQADLLSWKQNKLHAVLQLEGSRQVGKTTELQKFAYDHYEYVIYVNLADDKFGFQKVTDAPRMLSEMERYCRRAFLPGFTNDNNTVLLIDEIQNSPKVYNAIREMHAVFQCDIIVTGSYLGRILGNKDFFLPAGTIEYQYLFPLSFREFCRIYHKEELLDHISLYGDSADQEYRELEELYLIYMRIGGYPEVIKSYAHTGQIEAGYEVIEKLLKTFKEESRNYFHDARDVEIFERVYREALREMCSEKRGTGKSMIENITDLARKNTDLIVNKNEVARAVIWLIYTGILNTCDLAVDGSLKEIASGRRVYFSDCGIMGYLAGESMIDASSLTGLMTETFVFNELYRLFKVPYRKRKVMENNVCFSIYGQYEPDFILADRNRTIYGIEVKTKKGDPRSLKVFVDKGLVDQGVVAKPSKGRKGERRIDTIPVYTAGCRFPYD